MADPYREFVRDPYREIIASLPVPTAEQTERFAEYLVTAHSWYKWSPEPPGVPFMFFLDPSTDEWYSARRPMDSNQLAEYRARYGYWGYEFYYGRRDLPFGVLPRPGGGVVPISPDLLAAGTVSLTATMYTEYSAPFVQRSAIRHKYPEGAVALWERCKGDFPAINRWIEAERARQQAELRAVLARVRALLVQERGE